MSKDVDNITASTLFANNADNTGSTDEAENSSHSIPSLECPLPPSCRTISERKDESSSSTSGSSDKSKDYHYIARVQPKYVSCSFEPVAYEEIAMPEENEEYSSKLRKEMIVQKVGLATELDANNSNSMHSSDDTSSSGVLSHRDSTTKGKLETDHHSESIDSIRNDVLNKPDSIKILPGPRLTTSDSFISIDMKHFEDIRRKFILSTGKEFQACLKPSSSGKPTVSVVHQKSSEEFDQSSSATPVSLFENEKNKTFTDSNSLDDDIIESVDRGGKNRDKSATGKVKVKKGMELKNSSLLSIPSTVCRICHTNTPNEGLLSPCYCKGSLAYVHLSCLERWLNQSSRNYCELCLYQYNAVETLRYGFFEGVRLWVRHPRNRNHVRSDCLIAFLLTLVTLGLVVICFVGMDYFIIEGVKWGLSKLWTKSFIVSFLTVIMMGYMVTIYLIGKDQFLPWYTWWKNTLNIRLLLSPTVTRTQQI